MNISTNHVIIVILLLVIFYMKSCKEELPIVPTIKTVVETRWDTIVMDSITYIPTWKDRIVYKWETLPSIPIDTTEILEDYYSKYYYEDTISLDTLGNLTIRDTVTQNKIIYRSITPTLTVPITTIRITEYLNQREFYIGGGVSTNRHQIESLQGEVLLRSKNQQAFGAGIGINNQLQPTFSIRYYRKIGQ
jgi:hypothetical protein